MSTLNQQIEKAIDSLDVDHARKLLREAMQDANAETYFLASKVALDDDQKRDFLEKAVSLDPFHEKARAALKMLRDQPSPALAAPVVHRSSAVRDLGPGHFQTNVDNVPSELLSAFFDQIGYKLVKNTVSQSIYRRVHKQFIGSPAAAKICSFEITLSSSETSTLAHSRLIQSGPGTRFLDLFKAYALQKAELEDLSKSAASGTPTASHTVPARAELEEAIRAKVTEQEKINSPAMAALVLFMCFMVVLLIILVANSGL
ncbi:MAG: hypothetical protein SNJ83_10055 [Aggregatilineales bacterium]